VDVWFATCVRY